jgi:hypothetical protein
MTPMPARIIHMTIDRPWRDVYAFASQPENMPRWAAGLASGLSREGEDWIGDGGPIGKIRVRFAPENDFGVIDHTVTLETGMSFENALRVVPNGDGAEIMFTLLRQPGTEDQAFETDAAAIHKDLDTLKHILEQS